MGCKSDRGPFSVVRTGGKETFRLFTILVWFGFIPRLPHGKTVGSWTFCESSSMVWTGAANPKVHGYWDGSLGMEDNFTLGGDVSVCWDGPLRIVDSFMLDGDDP